MFGIKPNLWSVDLGWPTSRPMLKSEVFNWSSFCESWSLLTMTTYRSLHVPKILQYQIPNVLNTACHLVLITEMSGPIPYHHEITITNIDIKFKTHFASTSSRAQNTQVSFPVGVCSTVNWAPGPWASCFWPCESVPGCCSVQFVLKTVK
jgi:hypothetical protein